MKIRHMTDKRRERERVLSRIVDLVFGKSDEGAVRGRRAQFDTLMSNSRPADDLIRKIDQGIAKAVAQGAKLP